MYIDLYVITQNKLLVITYHTVAAIKVYLLSSIAYSVVTNKNYHTMIQLYIKSAYYYMIALNYCKNMICVFCNDISLFCYDIHIS